MNPNARERPLFLRDALSFGGDKINVAELTAVYSADTSDFERKSDAVDRRFNQSVRTAEKGIKDIERASARAHSAQIRAAENLLGRLPGANRVSQFKALADDIARLTGASGDGAGKVGALGGSIGVAKGAAIGAAAGMAAFTFAITALDVVAIKSANNFANYAANFKDLSNETGLTAETLTTLAAAGRLADVSIEQINSSLAIYLKNLSEAAAGNPKAAKTFERFGIDAKKGFQDPDLAARDLLDTLASIPNSAERLDAAFKLAGKGGRVLVRIAEEMDGSFRKFQESAKEWGIVLSRDDVDAADRFKDAMTVMGMKVQGILFDIGRGALPEVEDALKRVSGEIQGTSKSWQDFGRDAGKVLGETVAFLSQAASLMEKYLRYRSAVQEFMQSNTPAEAFRRVGNALDPPDPSLDFFGPGGKARGGRMNAPAPGGTPQPRTFGGMGGRSGGESAAKRAARLALESAQIDLREAESIYNFEVEIQKRNYDLNLTNFKAYADARSKLEIDRHNKALAVFEQERQAVAGLRSDERTNKLKDINAKEADETRKHMLTMNGFSNEGYSQRLDIQRQFKEASVRVQEEMFAVLESNLERSVERGNKTYQQAQVERLTALANIAERQGELLKDELIKALGGEGTETADKLSEAIGNLIGNAVNAEDLETFEKLSEQIIAGAFNADAAKLVVEKIREFFYRRRLALQQGDKETREALDKDIAKWREYADALTSIFDEIQDAEFARRELEIAPLAGNHLRRNASIEANRALEVAREEARASALLDSLRQRLIDERTKQAQEGGNQRADIIRGINERIEAEERLHAARIVEIDRQAAEARREQMLEIAADLADATNQIFRGIGGEWDSMWQGMLQIALNVMNQIAAELMRMSFDVLLTGQTKGSGAGGIVGFLVNTIGGSLLGGFMNRLPISGLAGGGGGLGTFGPLTPGFTGRGFAKGGFLPPGQWGIAGEEGPEPIFGGRTGLTVVPNQGAKEINYNVTNVYYQPKTTPDSVQTRKSSREAFEGLLKFVK